MRFFIYVWIYCSLSCWTEHHDSLSALSINRIRACDCAYIELGLLAHAQQNDFEKLKRAFTQFNPFCIEHCKRQKMDIERDVVPSLSDRSGRAIGRIPVLHALYG
ncbi:hypothetical protein ACOME3_010796 [Neoechinorhynchus agilis]